MSVIAAHILKQKNFKLIAVLQTSWASLVAQTVKNSPEKRPGFSPWLGRIPWRREWQPTPVFLPGAFHGQRSLMCYSPWDGKESDVTDWLTHSLPGPLGLGPFGGYESLG